MDIENTVAVKPAVRTTPSRNGGASPLRRRARLATAMVTCLCSIMAFTAFSSSASAQGALPDNACAEFEKWERGDFNPQYVDIVLVPLNGVQLPPGTDTVVNGLAGRKFQGQAQDQAIQKLIEFFRGGCTIANGGAGGGVGGGDGAATATPVPTNPTPGATPASTPTTGTPAPAATPSTSLPNTGFNGTNSGLAMIGGMLILAGIAIIAFNRQRN